MGKGLKLSVGLIVRNEERNLENCLIALQPLLNGIESELIIADTGSTDRTKEIAAQYTNKIYTFEWCDDFSKARNYVLDKAAGQWFFYIDADEWLEHSELIIEFLNSGDSSMYHDAGIIVRNYHTYSGEKYDEDYVKRIFRIMPGRKFEGMVHEEVPAKGNIKYIDACLHHYGYVLDEKKFGVSGKCTRNTPLLLKELEKKPDDLELLYQLAQEYAVQDDKESLEKVCENIVSKYGNKKDNYYVINTYWFLNELYKRRGDDDKIIKSAEPFVVNSDGCNIKILDIIAQALDALYKIKEFKKAVRYYKKFFGIVKECEGRREKGEGGFSASVSSLRQDELERRKFLYSYVLKQCKEYTESFIYLKQIKGILGEQIFRENADLWHEILSETGEFNQVESYYLKLKKETEQCLNYFQSMILLIWKDDPEMGRKIGNQLERIAEKDDFIKLQQIYVQAEEKVSVEKEELKNLLETIAPRADYYRLLYIALKNEIPVSVWLDKCSYSQICEFAYSIGSVYPDTKDIILSDSKSESSKSVKEQLFNSKIKEVLLRDIHLTTEQLLELFVDYVKEMSSYLRSIYRPEMISDPECTSLPDEHCFVLFSSFIIEYREKGDWKKCLLYCNKALKIRPDYKRIVKVLAEDAKKKMAEEDSAKNLFNEYGKKIKQIIESMIRAGNYDAAKEALTAYEKINPNDAEIKIFKEKIG